MGAPDLPDQLFTDLRTIPSHDSLMTGKGRIQIISDMNILMIEHNQFMPQIPERQVQIDVPES
jgi:hypothetical protein